MKKIIIAALLTLAACATDTASLEPDAGADKGIITSPKGIATSPVEADIVRPDCDNYPWDPGCIEGGGGGAGNGGGGSFPGGGGSEMCPSHMYWNGVRCIFNGGRSCAMDTGLACTTDWRGRCCCPGYEVCFYE